MKNVLYRNALEYSILIAMNAMAIAIGLHHPIPIAVRNHPVLGKYSMLFIFVHNTFTPDFCAVSTLSKYQPGPSHSGERESIMSTSKPVRSALWMPSIKRS